MTDIHVAIFIGLVLGAFVSFASAANHSAELRNMPRGREPFHGRVLSRRRIK